MKLLQKRRYFSLRDSFGCVTLLCVAAASLVLTISPSCALADPVRVVFDTDMSGDVDDCGALAVLNALADQQKAQILACVVNGHDADRASVATIRAINHYYGRDNVLTGAYHGKHGGTSKSLYTAKIRDEFPQNAPADDLAPSSTDVYREALASAPDNSVVVISVGFLMNLGDLLDSKPDAHSALPGVELVRKKVKHLAVMGGQFPNPKGGTEYNFTAYGVGPDTKHAIDDWPTPVLFDGFSIGQGISTGKALKETPASNPVRRAYQLYNNALEKGRSSWDPTTVLAAIENPQLYWNVVADGCCAVTEKGVNTWSQTPNRQHSYLSPKVSNSEVQHALDSLMTAPPAKRQGQH